MREAVCGDDARTGNEECDDGNTDSGDGCSSNCRLEAACGNGRLEPRVQGEHRGTVARQHRRSPSVRADRQPPRSIHAFDAIPSANEHAS